MGTRISRVDREAMRNATMGCWWPSRAFRGMCWSGVRNELELMAKNIKERVAFTGLEETPSAQELARLAALANAQIAY